MKPYLSLRHTKQAAKSEVKKKLFKKAAAVCRSSAIKLNMVAFLRFFPRFSSFTKSRQFCAFTKKSRSVFYKFKMSRLTFRDFARFSLIHGLRKVN